MIDYDTIRRLAERVEKDGGVILTSDTTLRLLEIIAVAKAGLHTASVCNADYHAGLAALDKIAKLENE